MKIKTGCVGWRTVFQGMTLAVIGGPFCGLVGLSDNFLWGCFALFLAPFIVDALRPVIVVHKS